MDVKVRREKTNSHAVRRGTTLVEVICGSVLLATIASVSVPLLSWIALERRALLAREEASAYVANLMDEITAGPWEDISNESLAGVEPISWIRNQLRRPEMKLDVAVDPDDPDAKRVTIELAWANRGGHRVTPVRLTSWVYRNKDRQ